MADTPHTIECDHGDRRRAIVQSLLTEVFQGRLQAGQRLITRELADRFGVSHTPDPRSVDRNWREPTSYSFCRIAGLSSVV